MKSDNKMMEENGTRIHGITAGDGLPPSAAEAVVPCHLAAHACRDAGGSRREEGQARLGPYQAAIHDSLVAEKKGELVVWAQVGYSRC